MYDKDVLIYATSKLMEAKNRGEPLGQEVVFEAQEALRFMHRTDRNGKAGGTEFRALETSLKRLKGTMLQTDIITGGVSQTHLFGLIDTATIYRKDMKGRVLQWGIKLSDWLYNSILSGEVLTLHPDYFRLRRPIEKRVYELARRHCGNQKKWKISLELLLKKTGSKSAKNEFKRMLKGIVQNNHLPDYHLTLDDKNFITFKPKRNSSLASRRKKKGSLPDGQHYTIDHIESLLDQSAIDYTKYLAQDKNLDWYSLLADFTDLVNTGKNMRDNMSASFVGYVNKKKRAPRY